MAKLRTRSLATYRERYESSPPPYICLNPFIVAFRLRPTRTYVCFVFPNCTHTRPEPTNLLRRHIMHHELVAIMVAGGGSYCLSPRARRCRDGVYGASVGGELVVAVEVVAEPRRAAGDGRSLSSRRHCLLRTGRVLLRPVQRSLINVLKMLESWRR